MQPDTVKHLGGRVLSGESTLERLRDLILRPHVQRGTLRTLKDGTKTSERAIAEELQVSRTPVREALAVLEQLAIVEQTPQVGVAVRQISIEEVEGVLQIREGIETSAVKRLARSADRDNAIAELGLAVERMKGLRQDIYAFMEADTSFHCSIIRLSGLGPHVGIMQSLRDRIHLHRLQQQDGLPKNGEISDIVEEHSRMVGSLRAGPREAVEAIEEHLANTLERLRHLSKSQPFAQADSPVMGASGTQEEVDKSPSKGSPKKVAAATA